MRTKIESVETILWDKWLILKIVCEDGTIGIGEGGVHGWQKPTKTAIDTMGEYLIGKDPYLIEHHYQFLYRSSHFMGSVIQGALSAIDIALWDIKGKKLDFPTANIKIHNEDKILPSDGVYAGYAVISDKKFIGMINIGKRPTVEGKERRVEMNIFDYNDMLYGKEMKISFIKRIRDERKFKNLDDLSKQLKKDKLETIKIIENEEI